MDTLANHAHVFPESLWGKGSVAALEHLMQACGIERAVAFAPSRPKFLNCAPGLMSGWWRR